MRVLIKLRAASLTPPAPILHPIALACESSQLFGTAVTGYSSWRAGPGCTSGPMIMAAINLDIDKITTTFSLIRNPDFQEEMQ